VVIGEEEFMNDSTQLLAAERRSLASVALTSGFIAVNHLYILGPRALILGGLIVGASTLLLFWFRHRASKIAFAGYLLMNLWIVVGFGLYKGLWKGVLRLFLGSWLASFSSSYPKPFVGSFAYEASGILMFVGCLFVAYYAIGLIRSVSFGPSESVPRGAFGTPRWLAVAGTLAAAGVIAAYVFEERDRFEAPANGVVTIGVIAPTTGPYSILGNSFVKAVEMAQSDLKGTKYKYELKIADSGPDPAKARDIVRNVIEGEKVDAVIGAVSLIGEVTKPFATKARIVHTCVCTVTRIGDGGYNFTNIPSPQAEAVRWVAEAQRRGIKRIAVISQDYPSINNHVKAMKSEARRRGLTISYEDRFADTVTNFRPALARAEASHPDVYYVEGLEPTLDILGQQLLDAKIRNIASVVAPSLSERPELFEGAWYTDSDLADMEFKSHFEARYPGTQFATHMMPYAYDSFNMIVKAYERGVNPAVYIRSITSYNGSAGAVVKAPGSGNFQSKPAVWMIKNGRPALLSSASTVVARVQP
jgi:ABC-type branched-subunit amino acid transport system substrate-binding protein